MLSFSVSLLLYDCSALTHSSVGPITLDNRRHGDPGVCREATVSDALSGFDPLPLGAVLVDIIKKSGELTVSKCTSQLSLGSETQLLIASD